MINAMAQQHDKTISKFIELARYIAANADESLTLETLAARVHLSPSRMQRVFKSTFGVSPKKFQQAARSERFKSLLRSGIDITDAQVQALAEPQARAVGDEPEAAQVEARPSG